ncbi:MAG: hypothetical protein HLUCCO18_18170 [Rhodobacteraceae bacterium HLUCCO18]|nr:MAG: hypothetical protein HLUCCO18_18170 [Rhodobacteraceae bacterium HLUCCO18]
MLVTLLRGSGCPGCSHCSGPCLSENAICDDV